MKIKILVLGEFICITLFFALVCAICYLIVSMRYINNDFIKVVADIVAIVSIVLSSFVTSKLGGGRGAVYGISIGAISFFATLIASIIFTNQISFINAITNLIIYVTGGFIGGSLGCMFVKKIKY